jgi:hypothetical protein
MQFVALSEGDSLALVTASGDGLTGIKVIDGGEMRAMFGIGPITGQPGKVAAGVLVNESTSWRAP